MRLKKESNTKKRFRILPVIALLALIAAGGMLLGLKAYRMYVNVWENLNETSRAVAQISENAQRIRNRVEHVERLVNSEMPTPRYDFDYSWAESGALLVAHGLGGIDGSTYTNSLEAFEESYRKGYRVFEVDFTLTQDEYYMIASHDERQSRAEFMNSLIKDKYHPLDYRMVVQLLAEYPDAYLITDTKYLEKEKVYIQFASLVDYARSIDEAILDRIIPQYYTDEMLDWIMDVYPFKSVIYTLYHLGENWVPEEIRDDCLSRGVGFVTLEYGYANREATVRTFRDSGIWVGVHTVNYIEKIEQQRPYGVEWYYTDFITPDDIR